jgi:hypothetical protein
MTLPTPDDLRKGHAAFLSTEPTERQLTLYDQFPAFRGLSGAAFDVEMFEATVVMALVQTVSAKVYFFVPSSMEKEAIAALQNLAESIFARIKTRKAVNQAKAVGKAFKAILIGHRLLQIDTAPERWVAFGFQKEDPIPGWLRDGLTAVQG